jgi:hypothetical protein
MSDKTRSKAEYMLDAQNKNTIIDVTSYHRRDYDLATIKFNPADHQPVRESLLNHFLNPVHASLGDLDQFPLELLHEICLTLDVQSLFHFRQLNRRSRQIVGALRQYQPAIEYGLDAFRALLKTGVAQHIPTSKLFSTLSEQDCHICSSFGGFIFLSCYSRCCFGCLISAPQLRARTLPSVAKELGIAPRSLRKSTPSLHTIPGIYSLGQVSRKRRMYIIAKSQLQLEAINRHGRAAATANTQELAKTPILTFMAAAALPYFNERTKSIQRGVCCKGCQVAVEMGLVVSTGDGTSHKARDRVYSHKGFLRHFQWCAQAQDMCEAFLHGQGRIIEPKWTRRGGCFGLRDVAMSH